MAPRCDMCVECRTICTVHIHAWANTPSILLRTENADKTNWERQAAGAHVAQGFSVRRPAAVHALVVALKRPVAVLLALLASRLASVLRCTVAAALLQHSERVLARLCAYIEWGKAWLSRSRCNQPHCEPVVVCQVRHMRCEGNRSVL